MFDPATLATLAGLIAAWDGLRDKRVNRDVAEFQRWLAEHAFEDLADIVAANLVLSQSIENLLHDHHSDILAALKGIREIIAGNNSLRSVAVTSDTPSSLAKKFAADPRSVLGEKDFSFLAYLVKEHDGSLMRTRTRGGRVLNAGNVSYNEREMDGDEFVKYWGAIDRLQRLNLIVDLNGNRESYEVTGDGYEFIALLERGVEI